MDKPLKKDIIADTALACFLSSGYNGTSMDEIVKASGISKGGIYWHFKSKDEIFLYIIEKRFTEWNNELSTRLKSDDSARESLSKFVEFFLELIVAPFLTLTHEFLIQIKDKEMLSRACALINDSNRSNVIKNVIKAGITKGEFKAIEPETAANVFISFFEGISLHWFAQQNDKIILERTAKTALDIFIEGISNS